MFLFFSERIAHEPRQTEEPADTTPRQWRKSRYYFNIFPATTSNLDLAAAEFLRTLPPASPKKPEFFAIRLTGPAPAELVDQISASCDKILAEVLAELKKREDKTPDFLDTALRGKFFGNKDKIFGVAPKRGLFSDPTTWMILPSGYAAPPNSAILGTTDTEVFFVPITNPPG